ncbi:MAG: dienelactone hydrolase family protein [Gammaproteobacteria bacterium]|nr:dienelactone hydrolase family protein [Gammaproteobacteria bacterium]
MTHRRIAVGIVGALGLFLAMVAGAAQTSSPDYRIFRPDGAGPHPAVIFLSGCYGLAPAMAPDAYARRAERLRAQGYIVAFADYLGRHGYDSCGEAKPADAVDELMAVAAWLKTQSFVDKSRITAMGWSYGGSAVLQTLASHTDQQLDFSRAVVFFPGCNPQQPWKSAMPTLMLLAGDDDVTPASLCQEAAKHSAAPAAVKVVVYRGALHAFDTEGMEEMRMGTHSMGYHPQAAAAAWEEVRQFLKASREQLLQDDSPAVPTKAEQLALVKQSTHNFVVSMTKKDMAHFRATVSTLWQNQFTTEQFNQGYKAAFESGGDWSVLDKIEPVLSTATKIGDDGVLSLAGHYPAKPKPLHFEQKYIYEESAWKLVGLDFQTK